MKTKQLFRNRKQIEEDKRLRSKVKWFIKKGKYSSHTAHNWKYRNMKNKQKNGNFKRYVKTSSAPAEVMPPANGNNVFKNAS